MTQIMIIEDDPAIWDELAPLLEYEGCRTKSKTDEENAT